ncbi:MAG TPA: serine/threonine-protein kinase [Polyangiaceae bacterium]|nr:serine/threonine-protein kinase [Polyangiaceae bacterium]
MVAELATGGMATVFLARLSGVGGFQRFVAIKRLHPHLAREPEFIEMFLEEARLAARIHHPNVVPILEIGQSEQGYYIVMEYVEGDTLGRLLARSAQTGVRLPVKVGLRVVIDMLAGLDAAHELKDDDGVPFGVVHRDISPQNVLVGVDGSARLSDFGVARATSKLSTTRTGQLKGKLAYMAPEQARGHKDVDRRADIFASGIVLWEVLACRRLFKGDGEADTLNRVMNEPIPPVRSAAPTIPAALEAVVAKALERDRNKRYNTAAEFADSLERASRVVGALGTHKDVALHLEAVLGTEISQQRDVVRAWLARSEPSRHGMEPPIRQEATSVTRVEGRVDGTPSSISKVSAVSAVSGVTSVSSVTSAVISNHAAVADASGGPPSASAALPAMAPRRGRVWPWVALVAAVAGGALWMRYPRGFGEPAGAAAPAAAPPVSVVASAAPPAPAPPSAAASVRAAASPDAASALAATAPPPAATVVIPRGSWRSRPAAAAREPTATAVPTAAPPPTVAPTAAPVPDDISRNPYR